MYSRGNKMSLCYDAEKWLMISLASIAISLSVGLLLQYAHGQDMKQQLLMSQCIKHEDSHLVVLDLTCEMPLDAVVYYSNQGYQIKAILLNTLMYMQK
jgi:hypothetical protein